jgi:hypothetical protein
MAMFGSDKEAIFMKCHEARRHIEVSASMLMRQVGEDVEWSENRQRQRDQWEADIWIGIDEVYPGSGRVSTKLEQFKNQIVGVCDPIAKHK